MVVEQEQAEVQDHKEVIMSVGPTVSKKEILHYVETTLSELTDAYNTAPDTPETSDTLYYIQSAEDLLNELRKRIEEEGKFVPHPNNTPSA